MVNKPKPNHAEHQKRYHEIKPHLKQVGFFIGNLRISIGFDMSKTKKARIDAPAKNGFNYKPKFGLIIQCDDEAHQQTVFERLKQLGYKAKVVVV